MLDKFFKICGSLSLVSVVRGMGFSRDLCDQNFSLSVMSIMIFVSVVKSLYLTDRSLEIIDSSGRNENTTYNVMSLMSIVDVVRGLYLILRNNS